MINIDTVWAARDQMQAERDAVLRRYAPYMTFCRPAERQVIIVRRDGIRVARNYTQRPGPLPSEEVWARHLIEAALVWQQNKPHPLLPALETRVHAPAWGQWDESWRELPQRRGRT